MKRLFLEIVNKVKGDDSEWYNVRIKEQSHRCKEFGLQGNEFRASNRIVLRSYGCPQWKPYEKLLYVRGTEKRKDNTVFSISVGDYKILLKAVEEYNEIFKPEMSDGLDDNLFEVQ